MKKIVLSLLLVTIILSSTFGQVFAAIPGFSKPQREIKVFIDSKEVFLQLPILCDTKNQRTLYPFRELLESVGANVNWEQHTKTARAYYNGIDLKFPLEQDYYYVNDEKRMMDTKTTSDPDTQRTYIPIRYAFEALGYEVDWIPCKRHDEIRISNLGPYKTVSDEAFVEMHKEIPGELYNKYTSSHYYDIDMENKRLLFKDGSEGSLYKNYKLEEKINPNINSQIYNLTKALIGEDQYIYVHYLPDDPYRVYMAYAKNMDRVHDVDNVTYFNWFFFEREYFDNSNNWLNKNFTTKSFLSLHLKKLWDQVPEAAWSTPFFEKKLRDSFIALFGEVEGKDIYKYVYTRYVQVRNMKHADHVGLREVKAFSTVKLDFAMDVESTLYFHFSYLK